LDFLSKNNDFDLKEDFFIQTIKSRISKIENLLKNQKVTQNKLFLKWKKEFDSIYGSNNASLLLYSIFSVFYFFGHSLISDAIQRKNDLSSKLEIKIRKEEEVSQLLEDLKIDPGPYLLDYFKPIRLHFTTELMEIYQDIFRIILKWFEILNLKREYYFDVLMQKLVSLIIRHKTGEFYTPPFLVEKMVQARYEFGESVLDPCCGSGNFLIAIVQSILSSSNNRTEKLKALRQVHGIDINPISVFLTRINLLLILIEYELKDPVKILQMDVLFENDSPLQKSFDLVIGNPPWYTLRDVEDPNTQERIKILADELRIKPRPKNVLNIEIATLFFTGTRDEFLKPEGKVFFVITKGVITGSHAAKFRNFEGFKKIEIWMFEKRIEQIFNIDFVCIFAQKDSKHTRFNSIEIPVFFFDIERYNVSNLYFNSFSLKLVKKEIYVPYHVTKIPGAQFTHKLVSKSQFKDLIKYQPSPYKGLFHKGADLNPRNLIFVKVVQSNDHSVEIQPDPRIFKRAKRPWNEREFDNYFIEKQYIFNAIKSTELVKFSVYDHYQVFLPLSREYFNFDYIGLKDNAKIFYDHINEIYLQKKKSTTKHGSIMDNLNRWEKLVNSRQLSHIKIVYNNSGNVLNSAVVIGEFLITGDLSFFATSVEEEAYYLAAILNSSLMNDQIRIKKSSRHIFKLPFEFPLEKFDPNNQEHILLASLGKKATKISSEIINGIKKGYVKGISKHFIQKSLETPLAPILSQIDIILKPYFEHSK
jgi:type I restriction-modification system DNA methylase subunit